MFDMIMILGEGGFLEGQTKEASTIAQRFKRTMKIRTWISLLILFVAMVATFKYELLGIVRIAIIVLGLFGYLWTIFKALQFMAYMGEEQVVQLYINKEFWDENDNTEWSALMYIYSYCAVVADLLPQETQELQLRRMSAVMVDMRESKISETD